MANTLAARARAAASSSVTQTGNTYIKRVGGSSGVGGGVGEAGYDMVGDRAWSGHPQHRAVGHRTGQMQHVRGHRGEEHGSGRRAAR